jgi:hypothetical protein
MVNPIFYCAGPGRLVLFNPIQSQQMGQKPGGQQVSCFSEFGSFPLRPSHPVAESE